MNKIDLCNNEEFKLKVSAILNLCFEFDKNNLESIFGIYNDNIDLMSKLQFRPKSVDKIFLEKYYSENSIVGTDVPTMLCQPTNSKGIIFIVGEDPLREWAMSRTDKYGDGKSILLSTPYALHIAEKLKGSLGFYKSIFECLYQNKYDIYFTDISKIWLKFKGDTKKSLIPEDLKEKFIECFRMELEIFSPKLVITFGKAAEKAINPYDKINKVNFIHPTFAARSHWKNEIGNASNDAILKFIQQKINDNLLSS